MKINLNQKQNWFNNHCALEFAWCFESYLQFEQDTALKYKLNIIGSSIELDLSKCENKRRQFSTWVDEFADVQGSIKC